MALLRAYSGTAALLGTFGNTIPSSGGVDNPALVLPIFGAVTHCRALWLWWAKTDELHSVAADYASQEDNRRACVCLISIVALTGDAIHPRRRHSDHCRNCRFFHRLVA